MKNKFFNIYYTFLVAISIILASFTISCEEDCDHEGDDAINPYVVSYNPVIGVDGVPTSANLVLTFDDTVYKGEGNITITSDVPQATQVIDVTSDAVTISNVGRIVTINPADFLPGRPYEVVVDANIVVDAAGNKFFGMPDTEVWTFTSGGNAGDLNAPELVSLFPEDEEAAASIFTVSMTFNEVVKGGSGDIIIYNSSNIAVATIDAESDALVANKETITVTLPEPLNFGESYYVQFADGVIKDAGGNNFVGITDDSSWNFTTTAGSSSDLIVHLTFDEDLSDDSGNKFDAIGKGIYKETPVSHEFVNDATRGDVIKFNPGSFAQLPKHDLLRPGATQNFSVNLWVKFAGTDSDPCFIGNKNWDNGSEAGWLICTDDGHEYVPGDDNDGWSVNISDGARTDWEAGDCTPTNAPSVSDDQWHMVTFTVNRESGKLLVYIDGSHFTHPEGEDISAQTGAFYDTALDYPVTIWEDGTGVYNHDDDRRVEMTGLMDELSIYNKVLSVDEIATLFAN